MADTVSETVVLETVISEDGAADIVTTTPVIQATTDEGTGIQGVPGGENYVHTQSSANSSWTVTHNLGRNPIILLISSGEQIYGRISYPTSNSALIEFGSAITGTAHCF